MMTDRRSVLVVRTVAVLHLALAFVGLVLVCFTAYAGLSTDFAHNRPDAPYITQFFWCFVGANFALLAGLGVSAWFVWKLRRSGLRLLCLVLSSELAYHLALRTLWLNPTLGMSAASATGIGNMGLAPQDILGYPISGLIGVGVLSILSVWKRAGLTRGSGGASLQPC